MIFFLAVKKDLTIRHNLNPPINGPVNPKFLMTPFSISFVTPGIHHQKKKNREPQEQQNNSSRLVFPQELKIPPDFVKIH